MNPLFINSLHFEWNGIPERSYVRSIQAMNGLDNIEFHSPMMITLTCIMQFVLAENLLDE